jgi:hypothetical protein
MNGPTTGIKAIFEDCKKRRNNLSMARTDYQEKFDSVHIAG